MESNNNIYVFHQGDAVVTPKNSLLFVFPYSENLTLDTMCQHAASAFGEKYKRLLDGTLEYKTGDIHDSVLKQGVRQCGRKKAIMTTYSFYDTTYLSVKPLTAATARRMTDIKRTAIESKINELIKLYEALTADTPASKLGKVLKAKNIYYYDERKVLGSYTFDKRSPEGMEFIKAKLVIKRERLLTQRAHNANAKHRDQCIDASRQELQEE
ncbi:hypothetical protein IW146_006577 [Coemansia sp. RSA 922]|nr:hypothetical protein H4S03_003281 [Coemansia sp. S3946]KAJ2049911.1 hypothetical protein H4S04_002932 [Coemansia sp. S16]KAJ2067714.1 hypothetical protein GGH13_005202 [Coemansia sp. S155-1]KAJ2068911.1 hypothetical protein GGI08_000626 [Coemansia sp. S2]KAJ2108990.1 hypothetical protein IW146_006577 [Coemansia sp. RSA 922]KAJ2352929.1 hypothetical protein GGH92_000970 [Coemansia sp. RSA 2673]KAJ2431098.1 hypothetical protein GGF41_000702 [Coemansia sp. RSA 2531]